jgi:polo-like kinase 1
VPDDSGPTQIEEKIVKVNGDVAVRRYTKGRYLGKGGFARVYEITNQDSNKV